MVDRLRKPSMATESATMAKTTHIHIAIWKLIFTAGVYKEKRPDGLHRSGVNHRESAMEEDCVKRIAAVPARSADGKLTISLL